MSNFAETVQQGTPRLVVTYRRDGDRDLFQWGMVGQLPLITLIGAATRVQGELPLLEPGDERRHCPQPALCLAWDEKERRFEAFAAGRVRVMIIKPKIGAWGLNWQHCAHVVTFGSHSYEQHYQSVRRCWRFGQVRPVRVDVVVSEGESRVFANLRRKAAAAAKMFEALVAHIDQKEKDNG